jgi:hypothetical protein
MPAGFYLVRGGAMPFISQIINKPVVDANGAPLGKIEEMYAVQTEGMTHPRITALSVRGKDSVHTHPISAVAVLFAPVIPLNQP